MDNETTQLPDRHQEIETESPAEEIGAFLFEWRDYTPIPLILLALIFARSGAFSAMLGTVVVLAGELIRIYAVAFIGSVSRTRNTESTGGALITGGPFSMVRNPLYVGNFLITMGMALFTARIWIVVVTGLAFAFQYYCIVKYEEKLLTKRFGREYEDYMLRVPAWVPARLPALELLEWPATFTGALRSERRTLTAIVVMLVILSLRTGG